MQKPSAHIGCAAKRLRTGHPRVLAALQTMIEGFADKAIRDYALPIARGSSAYRASAAA